MTTLDGKDVVSSLGYAHNCTITDGLCILTDRLLIWSAEAGLQASCDYERRGRFVTQRKGSLVVVNKLQAALHLLPVSTFIEIPSCLNHLRGLRGTEEGVFLQWLVPSSRKRRQNRRHRRHQSSLDPEAAKFSYLENRIQEDVAPIFDFIHASACRQERDKLSSRLRLLERDATAGARELLGRTDIAAEWRDGVVYIHLCHPVKVRHAFHNHTYKGICYQLMPLIIHGDTIPWFLSPHGRDLVRHSPSINCDFLNTLTSHTEPIKIPRWKPSKGLSATWHLNLPVMAAPPIFKSRVAYPEAVIRVLSEASSAVHIQHHASIRYVSSMAWDSKAFMGMMDELGDAALMAESGGLELGGLAETAIGKAGSFVSSLLSPLWTMLITLLGVLVGLAILGCVCYVGFIRLTRQPPPPPVIRLPSRLSRDPIHPQT